LQSLAAGRVVSDGSTLTMQVARPRCIAAAPSNCRASAASASRCTSSGGLTGGQLGPLSAALDHIRGKAEDEVDTIDQKSPRNP
jgi:hypothetical protein